MTDLLPGTTRSEVAVEGVRLVVHRAGPAGTPAGHPVLLLHGVPETSATWAALLPELARDRVVVAVDLKGLGGSEVRGPYDVPTLAQEMAALVLHVADGPVDVVGHDWGGVIALALAETRPELVHRLVVVNAPYRKLDLLHAWHLPTLNLPVLPELLLRQVGGEGFVRRAFAYCWKGDEAPSSALLAHYGTAYADPARQDAMLGYYRAAGRSRAADLVGALVARVRGGDAPTEPRPSVAARTLVVWGAADPVLPLAVGEAVVRDLGADTVMVTVPGVGHFPHEEAPEVVTPVIARFLREGDAQTPAEPDASAPAATATTTTPATTTKAPASKAAPAAKKAPATKKAQPAKKAPAPKAAPAAKKAPVTKAAPAAKKAPATSAPAATKAPATKAAPAAKKAPAAKAAPPRRPAQPPTAGGSAAESPPTP